MHATGGKAAPRADLEGVIRSIRIIPIKSVSYTGVSPKVCLGSAAFQLSAPNKAATLRSMTEEYNLVLEHLRHIRARVDRTAEDVQDLKVRMASIETKLAHMHADDVNQIHRIDRIEVRL